MDLLQNVDPNLLFWGGALCALICGGLLVLGFVFQLVGSALDIVGGLFGAVLGILGGGPVSWCGCLVVLLGCGICGGFGLMLANALQTCGTPDAVNFCRLFGR